MLQVPFTLPKEIGQFFKYYVIEGANPVHSKHNNFMNEKGRNHI